LSFFIRRIISQPYAIKDFFEVQAAYRANSRSVDLDLYSLARSVFKLKVMACLDFIFKEADKIVITPSGNLWIIANSDLYGTGGNILLKISK